MKHSLWKYVCKNYTNPATNVLIIYVDIKNTQFFQELFKALFHYILKIDKLLMKFMNEYSADIFKFNWFLPLLQMLQKVYSISYKFPTQAIGITNNWFLFLSQISFSAKIMP